MPPLVQLWLHPWWCVPIICTRQKKKKMSATQHALQFAFATVAVHTHCQLEYRPGWLLSLQIHALSFSLWLAQRNCQEEIKWHAIWIEMPYTTTHTVVYCLTCKQWGIAKDKRTVPCTFPVLTLNESLFTFSVKQVATVNIFYISFRLKLYHIFFFFLAETLSYL